MEERPNDFDILATRHFPQRRFPIVAATQTRDRRSRHPAARQRIDHRRLSAVAPAQTRDHRSRHPAARQRIDHRRLSAAAVDTIGHGGNGGASRMTKQAEPAICRFYRLIPDAPPPRRADRSADGTLPTRGYRYCEALASASGFGWYLYPPLNFSMIWDGVEIAWTYEGAEDWYPLRAAQFPGFRQRFEEVAPEPVKALAPQFLVVAREPGVV